MRLIAVASCDCNRPNAASVRVLLGTCHHFNARCGEVGTSRPLRALWRVVKLGRWPPCPCHFKVESLHRLHGIRDASEKVVTPSLRDNLEGLVVC